LAIPVEQLWGLLQAWLYDYLQPLANVAELQTSFRHRLLPPTKAKLPAKFFALACSVRLACHWQMHHSRRYPEQIRMTNQLKLEAVVMAAAQKTTLPGEHRETPAG
jgi:hypothetical protein